MEKAACTYAPPPNGQNLHEKQRFEVRAAADRDRQGRGGRDSSGGMKSRRRLWELNSAGFHLELDCNWDDLDFHDTRAWEGPVKVTLKKKKAEQKANEWREPPGLLLHCQSCVKVFDGCHTSGAPLLQLLRRPRSPRRHYGSKYWFHSIDWSLETSKIPDVIQHRIIPTCHAEKRPHLSASVWKLNYRLFSIKFDWPFLYNKAQIARMSNRWENTGLFLPLKHGFISRSS